MNKIVVSCRPNGTVDTLLKDNIIDSRKFGNRSIERITEIKFNKHEQRFYIKWLRGPRTGELHAFFDTYEKAVEKEVELVNTLRLQGYSF